jgi:hypothetical protein
VNGHQTAGLGVQHGENGDDPDGWGLFVGGRSEEGGEAGWG